MEIKRDPQPVTRAEWEALPSCSLELLDGQMIDDGPVPLAVLWLLRANVGLEQVVQFALKELWVEVLNAAEA